MITPSFRTVLDAIIPKARLRLFNHSQLRRTLHLRASWSLSGRRNLAMVSGSQRTVFREVSKENKTRYAHRRKTYQPISRHVAGSLRSGYAPVQHERVAALQLRLGCQFDAGT